MTAIAKAISGALAAKQAEAETLKKQRDQLLSIARDYRGSIMFQIRKNVKDGDIEGATMKRFTLRYVENIISEIEVA